MPDLNPDGSLVWPRWSDPPKSLVVDPKCDQCGAESPFWRILQPLGEVRPSAQAPGEPLGSGVMMGCRRCGRQVEYREPFEHTITTFNPGSVAWPRSG